MKWRRQVDSNTGQYSNHFCNIFTSISSVYKFPYYNLRQYSHSIWLDSEGHVTSLYPTAHNPKIKYAFVSCKNYVQLHNFYISIAINYVKFYKLRKTNIQIAYFTYAHYKNM